ncbi:MAG: hypothetical protein ACK5MA_10440 [Parachlamydiaceae bacterium]
MEIPVRMPMLEINRTDLDGIKLQAKYMFHRWQRTESAFQIKEELCYEISKKAFDIISQKADFIILECSPESPHPVAIAQFEFYIKR